MQAYLSWRAEPETGAYSATVGPFKVFIYPEDRLYLFHQEPEAERCIVDMDISDLTPPEAKHTAAELITTRLLEYLDQAQDLRPETDPRSAADFFSAPFRLFDAGVAGIYIHNQMTGDILRLQPDMGFNIRTGFDEASFITEINGRPTADDPPPTGNDNWKLWQEDDDPLGSYYTLNVWPLTLVIDPHLQKVSVQITDIDRPVAERTGFNSLDEARAIALELATSVLLDWLTRTRQAVLPEKAPARDDAPDGWQFEQYGDTDDPADGYHTYHLGPFQLAVEPNGVDAVVDISDPDFQAIRTGLTSVAEARQVACNLLASALARWQNELSQARNETTG
ncbi:MAG: hypothetical protein Kow0031_10840 [Anaerolineae bacterium]